MRFIGQIRDFFKNQRRNYLVMLLRRVFTTSFSLGEMQFRSIYISALGADATEVGIINGLGEAANAACTVPLGWLADRYSLKKVYVGSLALSCLAPLLFAFSTSWLMAIPAMAINMISMWSVQMLASVIIANSLRDKDRGTGYGLVTTLAMIPNLVSPVIGGYIVEVYGGVDC